MSQVYSKFIATLQQITGHSQRIGARRDSLSGPRDDQSRRANATTRYEEDLGDHCQTTSLKANDVVFAYSLALLLLYPHRYARHGPMRLAMAN